MRLNVWLQDVRDRYPLSSAIVEKARSVSINVRRTLHPPPRHIVEGAPPTTDLNFAASDDRDMLAADAIDAPDQSAATLLGSFA